MFFDQNLLEEALLNVQQPMPLPAPRPQSGVFPEEHPWAGWQRRARAEAQPRQQVRQQAAQPAQQQPRGESAWGNMVDWLHRAGVPADSPRQELWLGDDAPDPFAHRSLVNRAQQGQLEHIGQGEVRGSLVEGRDRHYGVGVRAFMRRAGVEHLLRWNPESRQVTLAGVPIPYKVGFRGRTYADPAILERVLQQVVERQAPTDGMRRR